MGQCRTLDADVTILSCVIMVIRVHVTTPFLLPFLLGVIKPAMLASCS